MNIEEMKKDISERFSFLREAFDPTAHEFMKLLEEKKVKMDDIMYFLLKIIAEFEKGSFEGFKENKSLNPKDIFLNLCTRYWHLERYFHMELSQIYENIIKWMKDAKSSTDGSKAKKKPKRS